MLQDLRRTRPDNVQQAAECLRCGGLLARGRERSMERGASEDRRGDVEDERGEEGEALDEGAAPLGGAGSSAGRSMGSCERITPSASGSM